VCVPKAITEPLQGYLNKMSTRTVGNVVDRFLRDPQSSVLVIRGKWGTGKTYFWRSFIATHRADSSRSRYSYVSLFGISSIKDLQLSTFVNTTGVRDLRSASESSAPSSSETPTKSIFKSLAANIGDFLPGAAGKSVSFAVENMAPHLIRDTLICLDDFERLPKAGIEFEEVLGFVSSLKEEKNCKVVLILNDEELRDRGDAYRRYREKVIDIEVLFEPSTDEAADLALPVDVPHRELILEKLRVLEVSNIRLIRKMVGNIRLVYPAVHDAPEWIVQSILSMAVLLTWIEFGADDNRPSIEFLEKWNSMVWQAQRSMSKKSGADPDDTETLRMEGWSELLDRYRVMSFGPYDVALERAISAGYIEDSGLEQEIAKVKEDAYAGEAEDRFAKAWRLYHDSFEDNQDEIISTIDRTFDAAAKKLSPGNADAAVRLLRNFGSEDLADELIERYMRIRGDELAQYDPDDWGQAEAVKDTTFRERLKRQYAVVHPTPSLTEVLKIIARRKGWSVEQMNVLSAASASDLYDVFKSDLGSGLAGIVEGCLQFASDPKLNHIAANATVALKRIAAESPINHLRVESKFGIPTDAELDAALKSSRK
jgi:hypothetical protein